MKKFKLLLIGACVCLITLETQAQDYNWGIGLRGGWTSGITVKHTVGTGRALEALLSSSYGWRTGGFRLTGLYEFYNPAFNADGWFWYYGFGAHIAYYSYKYTNIEWTGNSWLYIDDKINYFAFGIDGILGLEYKIPNIPFTVSVDIKPFLEIATESGSFLPWNFWDSAFSVRYVF